MVCLQAAYAYIPKKLLFFFQDTKCHLKNHWTNPRHVCTWRNVFFMPNAKYGNENLNFENFSKKWNFVLSSAYLQLASLQKWLIRSIIRYNQFSHSEKFVGFVYVIWLIWTWWMHCYGEMVSGRVGGVWVVEGRDVIELSGNQG